MPLDPQHFFQNLFFFNFRFIKRNFVLLIRGMPYVSDWQSVSLKALNFECRYTLISLLSSRPVRSIIIYPPIQVMRKHSTCSFINSSFIIGLLLFKIQGRIDLNPSIPIYGQNGGH